MARLTEKCKILLIMSLQNICLNHISFVYSFVGIKFQFNTSLVAWTHYYVKSLKTQCNKIEYQKKWGI